MKFLFYFYEVGDSLWAKLCAIAGVPKRQHEDELLEGKHGLTFSPSPTFSGEVFGGNLFFFLKFVCKLRLPVTIASFTPDDSVSCLFDHHLVCACWWVSLCSLPVKLPIQGTGTRDWSTIIIPEGCECPSAALALLHQLSWHSWSCLVKFKRVF